MPPTNSAAFFSFSRFAAKAAEFRISLTQKLHVGLGLGCQTLKWGWQSSSWCTTSRKSCHKTSNAVGAKRIRTVCNPVFDKLDHQQAVVTPAGISTLPAAGPVAPVRLAGQLHFHQTVELMPTLFGRRTIPLSSKLFR
jgi:hypothetical protein